MSEVYRQYIEHQNHYVRIVMQSDRWIYLAKAWPQKQDGKIVGFSEIREFAEGGCGSDNFRCRPDKFKKNRMVKTEMGFIPERKYVR